MGLLTDAAGFPLMVNAFEGNRAETTTMLPTIKAFMAAHGLRDVVIVAGAGMISEANMRAIEAEGLSSILGAKLTRVPHLIEAWHADHPGEQVPDGHIFTQPWPAGPTDKRKDQVFYYQYKHDRAPPHAQGHRRADRKGREGRRRKHLGQTEPVHQDH